jgi:N-acetylneuraminic acid mutarotase
LGCEKWNLNTADFLEVSTLGANQMDGDKTQFIVEGEIKGLVSGNSVDQHGHVWTSTINTPSLENNEGRTKFLKRDTGTFSSILKDLGPEIAYQYRAYALYKSQVSYGEVKTFTTNSISFDAVIDSLFMLPELTAKFQAKADIAISNLEKGLFILDYGIVWGNHPRPNIEENYLLSKGSTASTGLNIEFSETLTNLEAGVNYVRPYLIIGRKVLYGREKQFYLSNIWTQKADWGSVSGSAAVGFSIKDKGYILNGANFNFWEYNPKEDNWTQKADLVEESGYVTVGFSINDKGYILKRNSSNFWEYNPQTNNWTQKADFGGEERSSAVGFSINDKGYIGTGGSKSGALKDFWEYNPKKDSWTQKADLGGEERSFAVGFSINDKGYIGTGESESGALKDFWEYNPKEDSWTRKADYKGNGQVGTVGFSINNKGYLGLGHRIFLVSGQQKETSDFWEYNPEKDKWISKAYFKGNEDNRHVGFSINDKGYIGGGSHTDSLSKEFWEYTPDQW